jgi:hypothetical protein
VILENNKETGGELTIMLANRNIILSFRCGIGEAVSEGREDDGCEGLGPLTTPLELLRLKGR